MRVIYNSVLRNRPDLITSLIREIGGYEAMSPQAKLYFLPLLPHEVIQKFIKGTLLEQIFASFPAKELTNKQTIQALVIHFTKLLISPESGNPVEFRLDHMISPSVFGSVIDEILFEERGQVIRLVTELMGLLNDTCNYLDPLRLKAALKDIISIPPAERAQLVRLTILCGFAQVWVIRQFPPGERGQAVHLMIPLIPYIKRETKWAGETSFLNFLARISPGERAEVVKLATPLIKGTDKDSHQYLFDAIIAIPEGRRVQVLTLVELCLRGDDDFVESLQEVILQIVSIPVQERQQVVRGLRSLLGHFPNTSEYTSLLWTVNGETTPENIREAFAVAPPLLGQAKSNQHRADIINFLIKAPVYQATPEETEEFVRALIEAPVQATPKEREEFIRARVTPLELIKQTTTLQQRQELVRQIAPLISQADYYSIASFRSITLIPFEQGKIYS